MFSEEDGESLEWDLPPEDDSVDDDGDLPHDDLGHHDEVGERNSGCVTSGTQQRSTMCQQTLGMTHG